MNEFTNRVSMLWIDPDEPTDVTDRHWLWSSTRPAPGRFRRSDYGRSPTGSLSEQARTSLTAVLGFRPSGAVRMLSQFRRWGWAFNPITVFVVWHDDPATPVGAIAEVTNTPWKERTQYPVPLSSTDGVRWVSEFDKTLHVSPFLNEDFRYQLTITDSSPEMEVRIDVCGIHTSEPIVETAMRVTRQVPTQRRLRQALTRDALTTRTVSFAIHAQAVRLAAKRVPFVPHPDKRDPHGGSR